MLPLDIPAMASKGVPVLCIDTCSLLDIMRDPTREDALPVHRQAACDLVAALEQGKFHCLIADQVAVEFAQRDTLIQREALDSLKRLEGLVDRTNRLHAVFAPSVPVGLGHLKAQVSAARAIVRRWIDASHQAPQSGVVKDRAFDRVLLKIPPSKQGKNSAEDCVIFETYLDVVGTLRASGLQTAAVFLSSNKAEYRAPEISVELARLGTTYVPNMAAAKAQLGF